MLTAALHVTGAEDLRASLRRAGVHAPQIAVSWVTQVTDLMRQFAIQVTRASKLVFKGDLIDSYKSQVRTEGLNADHRVLGFMTSNRMQAVVQEFGRKPGERQPGGNLFLSWVVAHVGDFAELLTKRGKARASGKGDLGSARFALASVAATQAKRLAFVLAKSIGAKGYKGKRMFEQATRAGQQAGPGIMDALLDEWQRKVA